MDVVLDITELARNPVRTGIQRVVRELIRYWPYPDNLRLARFDPAVGLRPIPQSITPLLVEGEGEIADGTADEILRLVQKRLGDPVIPLPKDALVFVPEVFYDHERCAWYQHLLRADRSNVAFLLYDFIPWLFPHHIGISSTAQLMPYLQMVRSASRVAFISSQTKTHYFDRIKRGHQGDGPVLPLGADGLALPRQSFDPAKRAWVCIGSIDGRKNQEKILQAFRQLWQHGFDGELVLIGRVFEHMTSKWQKVCFDDRRFRHVQDASDEDIRFELGRARATIYLSEVEGFGLPPMESLQAGIPVIVSTSTPSIQDICANGQIRIDRVTDDNIRDAVTRLSCDDLAESMWREASELALCTWKDFPRQAYDWLSR